MRMSRSRLDAEHGRIDNSVLRDFAESAIIADSGSTYDIHLANGNVYVITLTANCTITFSNPSPAGTGMTLTPVLKQDASGGRAVTWPESVKWSGDIEPTLETTAKLMTVFRFLTINGGATWLGFAGEGYPPPPEYILWAWGRGLDGQLGLGDTANRSSPTQVGTLTAWTVVAAGSFHSVAIRRVS